MSQVRAHQSDVTCSAQKTIWALQHASVFWHREWTGGRNNRTPAMIWTWSLPWNPSSLFPTPPPPLYLIKLFSEASDERSSDSVFLNRPSSSTDSLPPRCVINLPGSFARMCIAFSNRCIFFYYYSSNLYLFAVTGLGWKRWLPLHSIVIHSRFDWELNQIQWASCVSVSSAILLSALTSLSRRQTANSLSTLIMSLKFREM